MSEVFIRRMKLIAKKRATKMMKWYTTWVSATPGKVKKGKDRIVIIKSLKGIINLFSCAPKAEGKLKTEITVRIFGLVKERCLPHSDPLSLELLKQRLSEHGRGFTVLLGRFLAEFHRPFSSQLLQSSH